jgi:hypothetical protein
VNLKTIADAIATTFGTVIATNGTETETLTATADLPNSVAKAALLVFPPFGDLEIIMGPRYADTYEFPVRLLRDPLSVPQRTRWLYAWATAMRVRIQTNVDLDVAGVSTAEAVSMRVEIDGEPYVSDATSQLKKFDVVEVVVRVKLNEVTTLAI